MGRLGGKDEFRRDDIAGQAGLHILQSGTGGLQLERASVFARGGQTLKRSLAAGPVLAVIPPKLGGCGGDTEADSGAAEVQVALAAVVAGFEDRL